MPCIVCQSGRLGAGRFITSASPCTSIEISVPALRLSFSRTAFGIAICPFDEVVALAISTCHGRTDPDVLAIAALEHLIRVPRFWNHAKAFSRLRVSRIQPGRPTALKTTTGGVGSVLFGLGQPRRFAPLQLIILRATVMPRRERRHWACDASPKSRAPA